MVKKLEQKFKGEGIFIIVKVRFFCQVFLEGGWGRDFERFLVQFCIQVVGGLGWE